jgi:ubiquinone biosynthesis protein COQ9
MVAKMKTENLDNYQLRIDLIKAMLTHVPFDGWTWEAMEQGAVDINFEKQKTSSLRIKIFKDLFKNGPIDFIDVFSEIIDLEVKENYNLIEFKPERVPEKIKKLIMIRLNLCQRYKEAVRSSISFTAIPVNARASLKILYRTCNSIWRIAGDKSTDFSFYTRRISLAAVYTSTLLFWLNDNSNNIIETEFFLDRRLKDIGKISSLKKPIYDLKKITNNFNSLKNTINIKSAFSFLKKMNNIKNSNIS